MSMARRTFLKKVASASGTAIVTPSLAGLVACSDVAGPDDLAEAVAPDKPLKSVSIKPYGELVRSLDSPELDIPENFRCIRLSLGGLPSSVRDGLVVPNSFDGMAAFPLPHGNVRLIRNHEMRDRAGAAPPIGDPHYDSLATGGTTSLEVRISVHDGELAVELVDEFVSLAGTIINCAGGPTPWGSWLSCEETTAGPESWGFDKPHGYVFEVPVDATGPVDPVPLRAMGRFSHEAVAVDPATGIVYQTEDDQGSVGFYRFIPDTPEVLADGGRLQMMAVTGQAGYETGRGQTQGAVLPVHWVDIADPDPAVFDQDRAIFDQGLAAGGARFERLEGAFPGDSGIYFVSTSGGDARAGQVFHYLPTSAEAGELRLVFESPSRDILDSPDNIVLSPRGGVVLCEDGRGEQYIRELDSQGRIVNLVRGGPLEFAGSCFSPDGRVMFFNVQGSPFQGGTDPGGTYALWGPWEGTNVRRRAKRIGSPPDKQAQATSGGS